MLPKSVFMLVLSVAASGTSTIVGTSLVYNMRIATTTNAREEFYEKLNLHMPHILIGTYVNQNRKSYNGVQQTVNGGLFNYIYSLKNWYVRVDSAVGRVHQDNGERPATHTQVDDLLFSAGYRHKISKKLNLAYSFLFGIPTHKDHGLEYFQFGTGHIGTGAQLDGIYSFDPQEKSALLAAARFIHFFKAKATVNLPTGRLCVDLNIGNLVDILVAYHRKWKQHHGEIGYNPGFLFNVHASPSLGDALPSHGIRSSWYATYRYIFLIKKHPMGFGLGMSYSFDHRPKTIGLKRVISVWGSYGINF